MPQDLLYEATDLLSELLRCKSITPDDDGAQLLIGQWLKQLGFNLVYKKFGNVNNLYATLSPARAVQSAEKELHFLFIGHSDVVPAPEANWRHPPFSGKIEGDYIYGRGAQDMKGAIAAFICAISRIKSEDLSYRISILITGDEEAEAINGTVKMLDYMANRGEKWQFALVGEPSCKESLGDVIKIGRRGSLNAILKARGIEGHVAYPDKADNAITKLSPILQLLSNLDFNDANSYFPRTNLEVTQIKAGNGARNVIAGEAVLHFNVRFNDNWNLSSLKNYLEQKLNIFPDIEIIWEDGASESFVSADCAYLSILQDAILKVTNLSASLDCGGGTSDARFVVKYCPAMEFGLCGNLMHKINERVEIAELNKLCDIYYNFLFSLNSLDIK